MKTQHIIPATITTLALAFGALGSSGSASAGFEFNPIIPKIDYPALDKPVVVPVCEDVRSPLYGWCLPDYVAYFDNINPTVGADGSGFIAVNIANDGIPSKAPLWSTLTVEQGKLVEIVDITRGSAVIEIEQSPYDENTWIIFAPNGIPQNERGYLGLTFEDAHEIDVTIEANHHGDVDDHGLMGLDDYRLDERRSSNNSDVYRYVWS